MIFISIFMNVFCVFFPTDNFLYFFCTQKIDRIAFGYDSSFILTWFLSSLIKLSEIKFREKIQRKFVHYQPYYSFASIYLNSDKKLAIKKFKKFSLSLLQCRLML